MSEALSLLKSIHNELKDLRDKIKKIDEDLLTIKVMILKEEKISKEEEEEIKRLLKAPDEDFFHLMRLRGNQNDELHSFRKQKSSQNS
jgi:Glu-tRNA(Gln) amidotransferase subunit E-like FAD-binding protein